MATPPPTKENWIDENFIPIRGLTGERASVVLFGDSLTQKGWNEGGWCSSVANLYQRRADVYNRGYGGYNSRWARYLLPHLFPLTSENLTNKHFLVVVWFGANDATLPSEKPHVPLEEYTENIRAILAHVQKVCR
jgi:lysophospholipase L1-like esterase